MAMRCPKCGNEVGPDEAFCGQCGTPTTPPAPPTEMVQTPQHSGLLSSYNTNRQPMSYPANAYNTGMMPPPNTYNTHVPPIPGGAITPQQSTVRPVGPQQQAGFYQDATESMSAVPGNNTPVLPGGQGSYSQQNFPGMSMHGGYAGTGQFGPQMQPFQTGNYTQHGYTPGSPIGQGYGYAGQPRLTPPLQKRQSNTAMVIASICLVLAILAVVAFGAIYFLRGHSSPKASITPTPIPTSAPSPTAAPSPTPVDTPTPTSVPSPTAMPTPAADPNFSWCGTACTDNGFIVEYPNGWNQVQASDKMSVQFLNPSQQDIYANFKLPTTSANSNASTLVDNDLQSVYATQSGYVAPTSKEVTTIGGETWTYAVAYYQLNGQKERVEVLATVHQGKGYVIELQAADSEFETVNTQYFTFMTGRFRFL